MEGPAQVLALAELGATFTRSRNGSLHLTREGGHSTRRVVHAEDATGDEFPGRDAGIGIDVRSMAWKEGWMCRGFIII